MPFFLSVGKVVLLEGTNLIWEPSDNKKVPISVHYFRSSRCMQFFLSVGKVVLLEGIKSALIMSFSAQIINKIPLKTSHIIVIHSHV